MYIDSYALIVQQNQDGGDTLQREGMWAFGKKLRQINDHTFVIEEIEQRQSSEKIIAKFEIEPGLYVRHPDRRKWYSNPWTTSRDQIVPIIAYCAAYEDYRRLLRLFLASLGRGFFAQNVYHNGEGQVEKRGAKLPDTYLAHLGLFIRAGGWYSAPFYPLLLFFDTLDSIGIVLNQVPLTWSETQGRLRLINANDVDDNNQIIAHLLAAHYKPTPISALNRWLYTKLRRKNNGNFLLKEKNPVQGALSWYHRKENGGNPEIAELYRPLIDQYFGQ